MNYFEVKKQTPFHSSWLLDQPRLLHVTSLLAEFRNSCEVCNEITLRTYDMINKSLSVAKDDFCVQ